MPTTSYVVKKQSSEELFKIVKEGDEKHYIMTAACHVSHGSLVPSHAYTILGVQELKAGGNVVHRLLKMRNPWGKERYEGPWNDKDP